MIYYSIRSGCKAGRLEIIFGYKTALNQPFMYGPQWCRPFPFIHLLTRAAACALFAASIFTQLSSSPSCRIHHFNFKKSSVLINNSSFLIHNSSFLMQNPSSLLT